MARVIVKHLSDDKFRDINCVGADEARLELALKFYKEAHYKTVCNLELGGTLSSVLDQAYMLTNSIDSAWYENSDILVEENASKGCRSTSIGDIIIVAHEVYVVVGAGFKHLDLSANTIFAD